MNEVFVSAFLGGFMGAMIATSITFRIFLRNTGKHMNSGIHDYLREEEEKLNKRIQRSKF